MTAFRTFVAICFVGLMSASFSQCRGLQDFLGVKFNLQRMTLPNGLSVLLIEDRTVPVVSYQTWVKVGSVDEKFGSTGLAHLFEHLMFKGTDRFAPKEFFKQLEAKGAQVNAYTTRDYTVFYENFTSNLLEKVIDMEADRLQNLKIDNQILETERMIVFEERRLRTDNSPNGRMQEALWQLAYQVHPYQWPVIGYPQDLLRLTADDLKAFFKKFYNPSNVTLVITGDVEAKKTFQLIEKYYGKIPGLPRPVRKLPREPNQSEERRLVLYDHVGSQEFLYGYHVTSASQSDTYALDVLSYILFNGTTSRGHREIVERLNIANGVSGSAYTPTYPGLFIMSMSMRQGISIEKGEEALNRLLEQVQNQGVTQEEIEVAVRQLTLQLLDSVRTSYGLGQLIGMVQIILGDADRYREDIQKYFKVKQQDVKRVAARYLHPNNRTVILMKPKELETRKKEKGQGHVERSKKN